MTRPSAYQPPRHDLEVGDRVRLVTVPDELMSGLNERDAQAVLAVIGKIFAVNGFNPAGEIELEFRTKENILHTIWVPRTCVKPLGGRR